MRKVDYYGSLRDKLYLSRFARNLTNLFKSHKSFLGDSYLMDL